MSERLIRLIPALLTFTLASATGCHRTPAPDVVATVNSHPITSADLDKAYNDQLADAAQQQEKPSAEQEASLRLSLLRELLIPEEILQQRAAKMNLTATPEEVDAKFNDMKAPFSDEQFTQRLAASHRTVDEIKRDLRRTLTTNKLLNKEINSRIDVSDADINAYFNVHKEEFNNKETQYHIAQILVTNTPNNRPGNLQGSKATSDEEARKKISALKNRVDSGEDFGSLAMNFSENPTTSTNGGDMGSLDESKLPPPLVAVLGRMKPGQTTDIWPFPDPTDPTGRRAAGYAIFQLISKDPAGQQNASDPQVQQRIRQGLKDARSQLLKGAYFEMLRDQAKVENFYAERIFKADAK